MHSETWYKLCKFCENRIRNTLLRGVYIPHFDQISVKKFQFWGSYALILAPMEVKFGTEEGTFVPNFTPSMQHVAPAGRKTSQ